MRGIPRRWRAIVPPRSRCCTSGPRARRCAATPTRSRPRFAHTHAGAAPTRTRGAASRCCTTSTTSAIRPSTSIPQDGAAYLRDAGYPEWFIRAVLSHANHLQDVAARESDLERVLFACDELAGFVHACALVRPEGLSTLEPRSVRKKLKQKSFASGVNRDDVIEGAEELGVDLDEHIMVVIEALRPIAAELGTPG